MNLPKQPSSLRRTDWTEETNEVQFSSMRMNRQVTSLGEANAEFTRLGMLACAIVGLATIVTIATSALPSASPYQGALASVARQVTIVIASGFYLACLFQLLALAFAEGFALVKVWLLGAFVTGVWPVLCLMAALALAGTPVIEGASAETRRREELALILPAIQIVAWSAAALIGRLFR